MESVHWVIVVVIGLVVMAIIRNILNPPRELPWSEVPEELRKAFEASLPDFEIASVRYIPVAYEYKVKGIYRGREGRAELECSPKGELYEIEYDDASLGCILHAVPCEPAELPTPVFEHFNQLLGAEQASFQPESIRKGTYQDEPAFKIKGYSEKWKWEFELTAAGMLLELEKSVRR